MHVYIESLGLSTAKQNKLLLIALGGSVLLHGASLFLSPVKFANTNNKSTSQAVTISHSNMQDAVSLNSPVLNTYIPEVALDAPSTRSNLEVTFNEIVTEINISTEVLSPDAPPAINPKAQAIDALVASPPLELSPTLNQASIIKPIGLQNLLKVESDEVVLENKDIAISFAEIPNPNLHIPVLLTAEVTELIEEVPIITEATVTNKEPPASPLFGITSNFKQQIKSQLSTSIISIKPKIIQQQLEGSLRFEFTINRDGELVSSRINKSSGNQNLDALVLKMLKDNSPYAQLPKAYSGELLRFSYPIAVKLK